MGINGYRVKKLENTQKKMNGVLIIEKVGGFYFSKEWKTSKNKAQFEKWQIENDVMCIVDDIN